LETLNCPKCGEEVNSEMKFCPKCGAQLGVSIKPSASKIRERSREVGDILRVVSAGVILTVIGLTYIRYPVHPSVIIGYFESMGNRGTFIKPPLILLSAAVFFFCAVGVWGIALSALRIVFQRSVAKALGDLIGGFFSFFLAFLLTSYATDVFSVRTALAYFVVAIGLLVIVKAIIHFAFREK